VLAASIIELMTMAASTCETSVNSYQTRPNIPEGSHLHTRRRKNPKDHLLNRFFNRLLIDELFQLPLA
jgi:hypothetical protein